MPEEIEPVEVPLEGLFLYQCFWDLYNPEGLRWSDIVAYQAIYDFTFSGEDLSVLHRLFNEAIVWQNKSNKEIASKSKETAKKPRKR